MYQPSVPLADRSPLQQAAVVRNLLPHKLTPETARALAAKSSASRKRKAIIRKSKKDRAWHRVTHARILDIERRLLNLENQVALVLNGRQPPKVATRRSKPTDCPAALPPPTPATVPGPNEPSK